MLLWPSSESLLGSKRRRGGSAEGSTRRRRKPQFDPTSGAVLSDSESEHEVFSDGEHDTGLSAVGDGVGGGRSGGGFEGSGGAASGASGGETGEALAHRVTEQAKYMKDRAQKVNEIEGKKVTP